MRAALLLVAAAACDQGRRETPPPVPVPPAVQGIRGTVIGSGSSPVPGGQDPEPRRLATVTVRVLRDGTEVGRAVTDDAGTYSLTVSPGRYHITFDSPGSGVECEPPGTPPTVADVPAGTWVSIDRDCTMYFK